MIRVYWNLHKNCYSMQRKQFGKWKVVAHFTEAILDNVEFRVSAAGQARVVAENVKNVHAFLVAERVTFGPVLDDAQFRAETTATYDPLGPHGASFVDADGTPVKWAYAVRLTTVAERPVVEVEGCSHSCYPIEDFAA